MSHPPENWAKPRGNRDHLSAAEIAVVEDAFKAGRSPRHVARQLGCSTRSVGRRFTALREGRSTIRKREPALEPVVEVKRVPVDRFYRGSFEL